MCLRQALVVRKAPSKWIASIFFPVAEREFGDRLDNLDAGIADEDVQPAEPFDGSCNTGIDRGAIAYPDPDAGLRAASSRSCPARGRKVRNRLRAGASRIRTTGPA